MCYVLYRLICNLVPFATDMIYGRHLGFQNYPILVFWQCNPVNPRPNLASTQHTFANDVLSLLATCEDMWNPFLEDNGDMLTLDTGRHEQRCDTNSKRSGRDRSTSIQRICGGQAEHCIQQTTEWHCVKEEIGAVQYTSNKAEVKKQGTSRIFEDKLYSLLSFLHCLQS